MCYTVVVALPRLSATYLAVRASAPWPLAATAAPSGQSQPVHRDRPGSDLCEALSSGRSAYYFSDLASSSPSEGCRCEQLGRVSPTYSGPISSGIPA